jgi:hypothetical protein
MYSKILHKIKMVNDYIPLSRKYCFNQLLKERCMVDTYNLFVRFDQITNHRYEFTSKGAPVLSRTAIKCGCSHF